MKRKETAGGLLLIPSEVSIPPGMSGWKKNERCEHGNGNKGDFVAWSVLLYLLQLMLPKVRKLPRESE
jgi:hypothetical protein